jgi:2'-5' RNA ligase
MSYFLEIWLRGYAEDHLRSISNDHFHPHITLTRPFEPQGEKDIVKRTIESVCRGVEPIPFIIEDVDTFEQGITYADVTHTEEILALNDRLEEALHPYVHFATQFDDTKKLHVTIKSPKEGIHVPRIEQYMLRLTALRDKKVWFSYDFVQNTAFSRTQSLDNQTWRETVSEFERKYKKKSSKNGFIDV